MSYLTIDLDVSVKCESMKSVYLLFLCDAVWAGYYVTHGITEVARFITQNLPLCYFKIVVYYICYSWNWLERPL